MQHATAGPVEDLGALVLGEDPAHRQRHPLLVGARSPAVDEDELNALARELVKHNLLINEAPRQPIRVIHHDGVELLLRYGVAQRVEPWAPKRLARPAIVEVAVLRVDRRSHRRNMVVNGRDLRLDRALLLLPACRDPCIHPYRAHVPLR
ncbi:hypothetical protein WMF33_37670 [Sorangium sp. So ce394]